MSIHSCAGIERFVNAGDPANTMFLLQTGTVNITSPDGKVVAQFGAGQSFMEYAASGTLRATSLLWPTPQPATRSNGLLWPTPQASATL